MKRSKAATIYLVVFSIIGIVSWLIFFLGKQLGVGKCGLYGDDLVLKDPVTEKKIRDAFSNFEALHNLDFDLGPMPLTCPWFGKYDIGLLYKTSPRFSKYKILYEMDLGATYDSNSNSITLHYEDGPESLDVLKYITSLDQVISEFESNPQVDEFVTKLGKFDIHGIILGDTLWIETGAGYVWSYPYITGSIFYSFPNHSIRSYRLPNRITWNEFPEVTVVHKIVNEQLLVGELSSCSISTELNSNAETYAYFHPDVQSINAGVRLSCKDATLNKYLSLILHPDGSYELEK